MRSLKPEYREAERNAGCRACSKTINKGEKMVSWYSHWNSGMHIILCKDCVSSLYDLVFNQLQPAEILPSENTNAPTETINC